MITEKELDDLWNYYFNPTEEQKKEQLEFLKDSICMKKIRDTKILDKKHNKDQSIGEVVNIERKKDSITFHYKKDKK